MNRNGSLTLLLATIAFLATSNDGHAGMGPLDDVMVAERDQSWNVQPTRDGWRMTNDQAPGAIRYFYVNEQPGDAGNRAISVEVAVDGGQDSLAGILYGFNQNPRSYYLYTLGGDNSVNLHYFGPDGFEQKMQFGIEGLRGAVTLGIQEYGQEIALMVNGQEKSRLGNDSMGRGGVGIVAVNTGDYVLENFAVRAGRRGSNSRGDQRQPTQPATAPARNSPRVSSTGRPDVLRLKRAEIRDTQHPSGAMVAVSTLVPADWQTTGGVDWSTVQGCLQQPSLSWAAHSPDKQHAVAMLPPISWGWTTSSVPPKGCIQTRLDDAAQVASFYLQNLPGVRAEILDVARPDEIQPLIQQMNQQIQSTNPVGQQWADIAVLKVRSDDGDVKSDSYMIAMTTHWYATSPDGWGGMMESGGGYLAALIAVSTEQGKLDQDPPPALATVMSNMRIEQDWMLATGRYMAKLRRIRFDEQKALFNASQAAARSNSSILDSAHDSFRQRSASGDRTQRRLTESVWETNTYDTPDGERMFSTAYDDIWLLDNGDYALSNDPSYQPFRDSGVDGRQLNRVY